MFGAQTCRLFEDGTPAFRGNQNLDPDKTGSRTPGTISNRALAPCHEFYSGISIDRTPDTDKTPAIQS